MSVPLLAAAQVSRFYRRGREIVRAVDDVSLVLRSGTMYALQGPSGSGKTTLLNLLAGWERPDVGDVTWQGVERDPGTLSWSDLAVVPQRVGLLPYLSAGENATLAGRIGGDRTPDLGDLFVRLDLAGLGDAFPDELSAGQQQRVAIARAIGGKPAAVLVDEPTSSQDADHARVVLGELSRLTESGTACVVAGHDPITLEFADEVIVMRDGRLSTQD